MSPPGWYAVAFGCGGLLVAAVSHGVKYRRWPWAHLAAIAIWPAVIYGMHLLIP